MRDAGYADDVENFEQALYNIGHPETIQHVAKKYNIKVLI